MNQLDSIQILIIGFTKILVLENYLKMMKDSRWMIKPD